METRLVAMYKEISVELKKVLIWCKKPDKQEPFDLDALYSKTFKKYGISMNYGFLYPIFSLVDVMCDSIRHGQSNIKDGYSMEAGIADLERIINSIDTGKIQQMEDDVKLRHRLNRLYN